MIFDYDKLKTKLSGILCRLLACVFLQQEGSKESIYSYFPLFAKFVNFYQENCYIPYFIDNFNVKVSLV